MKNEHLLSINLHDKVPNELGAYIWVRIKKCPKRGDIYQDFCMDYGCRHMDYGDCTHPKDEVIREGYKKS